MFEFISIVIGYFIGFVLFFNHQKLSRQIDTASPISDNNKSVFTHDETTLIKGVTDNLSIIIPARNEESNIALILEDLSKQSFLAKEIILVDDDSSDKTAMIAKSFGVKVIRADNKPDNWFGKSWACNYGVDNASGNLYLFLDADVRLSQHAIARLSLTYALNQATISIQPYHCVDKLYEHASFFFNINLIAANGVGLPFHIRNAGLFGPLILISKDNYLEIGGHCSARVCVVEDLKLGEMLYKKGIKTSLYWGDKDFSFKMYRDGIKDLFHGWSKNFACGVAKTPFLLIVLMFFWFYSATLVSILFIQSIFSSAHNDILMNSLLYVAWVFELMYISRKIGNFKKRYILFYPVMLFIYLLIFATSIIKKVFNIKTVWKGRKITVNENINSQDL